MRLIPTIVLALLAACGSRSSDDAGGQQQDTSTAMAGMAMPGTADSIGADGSSAPIRITSRQAALAGVTFAVAREAPVERTIRAVAMVTTNERTLGAVNARVSGWVEKLHANETGQLVKVGEPLLELYSPELVTAQEEYLLAKRLASTTGGDAMVSAALRRLSLWNIAATDIAMLESSGHAKRTLTIRSPYRGNIIKKNVIEGQLVKAGDPLFEIADLTTVWIEPAIFEQDIGVVKIGQRASVRFDALPGRTLVGKVTFISPQLDMRTRTLKVRLELANPTLEIKPMMYGTVRIRTDAGRGVQVPLTAVLPTGKRDLAFVMRGGEVVPTPVQTAGRGDSTIMVTSGLTAGDTVVASATFLFDSESSLAAAMKGLMLNMGMGLEMEGMSGTMDGMEGMEQGSTDTTKTGMDMTGSKP